MTSKTLGTRARATIALLSATVALSTPAVVASAAEARNLGEEANFIMTRSYNDFIHYKLHGPKPYPFDFSSDGCSPPTPAGLKQMFDAPCQQHDFGYRNYGRGLRLGRNEGTRRWIDDRLHAEMDRLCDDRFRGFAQQGNNTVCKYQSDTIYSAVSNFGGSAFYG